ncbi:MAG: hypothetical protein IJQ59_03350 [Bacteroidaceae bacterium]|nr:hypothetical protein [Bacteroidaceae bacterium]
MQRLLLPLIAAVALAACTQELPSPRAPLTRALPADTPADSTADSTSSVPGITIDTVWAGETHISF